MPRRHSQRKQKPIAQTQAGQIEQGSAVERLLQYLARELLRLQNSPSHGPHSVEQQIRRPSIKPGQQKGDDGTPENDNSVSAPEQ